MKERILRLFSKIKFEGDSHIVVVTVLLSFVSFFAMLTSTGTVLGHMVYIALAYGVMFFFYKIDYEKATKWTILYAFVALVLLLWTLFAGTEDRRGIVIGGFSLQTFYFVGFIVVYTVARMIARKTKNGESLSKRDSIKIICFVIVFCALMALANMSTSIILFCTALIVMIIGKIKPKYCLMMCAIVVLGGSLFLFTGIGRAETFKGRVAYWWTQDNADHYGDQMILAKAAIARSGWAPTGPGKGVIKKALPEKETDYVFATVFEEAGIVVGLGILFLYLVLFTRAYKIALNCQGLFGTMLAMGIGFWFTGQALVHIAVNTQLIPATGQTLPFISRGGASQLISGMMIGVLLNISKKNKLVKKE
ncbi:MAG: FtsW/RodA/SpoVE family cell cycle protein [Bacteroidales bacterium]|nr:FtsW/RodA/SpoVE family cell cycle protein [Bacteroidales bacterium]